ncbi:MAG TPA: TlyA family RNA methyltransferase [Kaistiaceae bacterium]|nr:TlyA family RNA methyltransferase [Kaistiaceae bacterium]
MARSERGKTRLDQLLVARGLMESRSRARDAILRGCVSLAGRPVAKPGLEVAEDAEIAVADPAGGYVSRAALKLAAALDAFGFDPKGRVALDVGASTGGFTELLLERGATRVYAVDVGHGQLAARLADDARVVSREGVNARALSEADVPEPVGAIVVDVSFISLALVLEPVLARADEAAFAVLLVKPQFEVGREALGKGGIVRDPADADAALERIADLVARLPGWRVVGRMASPIAGGDGNREFLLGVERCAKP